MNDLGDARCLGRNIIWLLLHLKLSNFTVLVSQDSDVVSQKYHNNFYNKLLRGEAKT